LVLPALPVQRGQPVQKAFKVCKDRWEHRACPEQTVYRDRPDHKALTAAERQAIKDLLVSRASPARLDRKER
jgi:hypothetical protein